MTWLGYLTIFMALFAIAWLWLVNGRPRTIETFVSYLIVTALGGALGAVGGAFVHLGTQ